MTLRPQLSRLRSFAESSIALRHQFEASSSPSRRTSQASKRQNSKISRECCQWTRILTRLVNPNLYEPEARTTGGFLHGHHACLGLESSLLPTYSRADSVADPLPDRHD